MLRALVVIGLSCCALTAPETQAQQGPAATSPAAQRPTVNLYGLPGVIDMPSAEAQPEGELTASVGYLGGIYRYTVAFQASQRLSGAFRYSAFKNWNSDGFSTFYDRSFDLRYQLAWEGRYRPAIVIGLQDIAGTGVSAGEYIVATKTLRPGLTVTGGLGWGRLGSSGSIGSPFGSSRPSFEAGDTGGELSINQWFRGPAAPFAGVTWRPNDRWAFKLEYSSDAYIQESVNRSVINRTSSWNVGVEYQLADATRIGAYYAYGDSLALLASFSLNPARRRAPVVIPAPAPLTIRPDAERFPQYWATGWAQQDTAQETLREALRTALDAEGQRATAIELSPFSAKIWVENNRYRSTAMAIGRIARAMAGVLPASVETFRIILVDQGLPISTVTIRRSDLEALVVAPDAAEALEPLVGLSAGTPFAGSDTYVDEYPRFAWSLGPYFRKSLFDPDNPILFEVGLRLRALYELRPGLLLAGSIAQEAISTLDEIRTSASALPPVRTSVGLYEDGSDPVLETATLSSAQKLTGDFYGRATVGYLERMFGGISGEVLWKPVSSPLALGVEMNYARQRSFQAALGFQSYDVLTGHVSAYFKMENGFHTQLDVGRYLAGDWGATLTIDREFTNGWRVGGFATMTNVSSEEFGEGSFDKGIRLTIPLDWSLGRATKAAVSDTIRPIQRDGGARLFVPGRLYDRVRPGDRGSISNEWGLIWR